MAVDQRRRGAATLLWLATSIGLFAYVQSLGSYETTYGSLAGVGHQHVLALDHACSWSSSAPR